MAAHLAADDWKTGKDRKKEPPVRGDAPPEITTWYKIWPTVLLLGLLVIVVWAVMYWKATGPFTDLGAILLAAFGLLLFSNYFFVNKCPKCKRRRAIEYTGATRSMDGGFWSRGGKENKRRCKYCGIGYWEKVYKDSGGG